MKRLLFILLLAIYVVPALPESHDNIMYTDKSRRNTVYMEQKQKEVFEILNEKEFKQNFSKEELLELLIYIDSLCDEYDVNYLQVKAVIATESRWDVSAHGAADDRGLMQITPICAKQVKMSHTKCFNPFHNVKVGIKYLAWLKKQFNREDEILTAYNAGIGNVRKRGLKFVKNHYYHKRVFKWKKKYKV